MRGNRGDFDSSLYLGLRHSSDALPRWQQLTTGAPVVLGPTAGTTEMEARLRRRLDVEVAFTTASTLHALADIRAVYGDHRVVLDEFSYPVADLVTGPRPARFRHRVPGDLARCLELLDEPAVVIVDGWCTVCGRPAPIREYARIVRRCEGLLVVDDTQAWGVIGRGTMPRRPVAADGDGSVVGSRLSRHPAIVTVASAAKAYGVPIAVVAGPTHVVERLRVEGPTRIHCSQPSGAHLAALASALDVDDRCGHLLRRRLHRLTRRLVASLQAIPIHVRSGGFPVVGLDLSGRADVHRIRDLLQRSGVQTVVVRGHDRPLLTFIVRADHRPADIDHAGRCVRELLGETERIRYRSGSHATRPRTSRAAPNASSA